jgi:hypothetical protein
MYSCGSCNRYLAGGVHAQQDTAGSFGFTMTNISDLVVTENQNKTQASLN